MRTVFRRTATTITAMVAVVALTASTAGAHECFNASRSAQANSMIAAHSHGWFDIQTWQLVAIFVGPPCDPSQGQCLPRVPGTDALLTVNPETLIGAILGFAPPQALGSQDAIDAFNALVAFCQQVAAIAAESGVPTHYLTLNNATGAGGASHSHQPVTTNGKGIDHFPDVYGSQLIAAYFEVLGT